MARSFETDIQLSAQRELRLADADSSNYVGFKAPSAISANRVWTLPASDGTNGQQLSTNGAGVLFWSTASGGGLTHFVESESTAAPNATVPVDAFVATDASYTDLDVAIVAKGTGALLAQIPDSATAAGNKRGARATDWQKSRSTASQVASGADSTVGGGASNAATSSFSTVAGGQSNTAGTNTHPTVCGGNGNSATGGNSFVGGGIANTASGQHSAVCGGTNNTASAARSTIVGGDSNLADGAGSTILGGVSGTARGIQGYVVAPASLAPMSTQGSAQTGLLILARQTTNATPTVLTSNLFSASATNQVSLPNNSAYSFSGEVIAGVTGGSSTARWTISGAIKRGIGAGSTTLVGTPTVTMTHNDALAGGWVVALTADTSNGALTVTVTGSSSTTIRWVAKINTTEMTF